jgi:hypothetical protein
MTTILTRQVVIACFHVTILSRPARIANAQETSRREWILLTLAILAQIGKAWIISTRANWFNCGATATFVRVRFVGSIITAATILTGYWEAFWIDTATMVRFVTGARWCHAAFAWLEVGRGGGEVGIVHVNLRNNRLDQFQIALACFMLARGVVWRASILECVCVEKETIVFTDWIAIGVHLRAFTTTEVIMTHFVN